jgi:hypothetical protein
MLTMAAKIAGSLPDTLQYNATATTLTGLTIATIDAQTQLKIPRLPLATDKIAQARATGGDGIL